MPNGAPWTQDYFLARLAAETGWVLARSNYSKYETGGQTPKPETLDRFVRFWALYDEPAPSLTPVKPVEDPTLLVLTRIAVALEKLAGISPEDPEPQLSPGDSTMLRSLAKNWQAAPTTPRGDRPEEVAT